MVNAASNSDYKTGLSNSQYQRILVKYLNVHMYAIQKAKNIFPKGMKIILNFVFSPHRSMPGCEPIP